MDLALKDRRVLITGGSQGLGKAIARGFLAEGARVVVVSRDQDRLQKTLVELAALGPVEGKAVDLSQRGAPEAVADAFREVDVLVNNAGAIPTGDIFSVDETRWREAWDLKVFGYINLMRAMYPHMRGKPPKVIVNVLGLGGEKPQWHYVCGNAANVALMGVTKSLGGRSIDDGIRVVGVNPGGVETERMIMIQRARAQREFGDAETGSAVLFRHRNPEPAGRGEGGMKLMGKIAGAILLEPIRIVELGAELADLSADLLLLRAQREIHCAVLPIPTPRL
jgi:NAD(P)-dependent dehydrogenase (short-subunit alcohol dehydrogenase family)